MDKCLPTANTSPRSTQWTPKARRETHCGRFAYSLVFQRSYPAVVRKNRQARNRVHKKFRRNDIKLHVIEPDRHSQNPCEGVINEVQRKCFHSMIRGQVQRKFWDYGMRWVCEVIQRTSTQAGGLGGVHNNVVD